MVMSPLQMMLLFRVSKKSVSCHTPEREFGPLPHRHLRLMCFLPLSASELTVYSWVCKYRFMSNQSCRTTPT